MMPIFQENDFELLPRRSEDHCVAEMPGALLWLVKRTATTHPGKPKGL